MNKYIFLFNLSGVVLCQDIYSEIITRSGLNYPIFEGEQPFQKVLMELISSFGKISISQAVSIISDVPKNEKLLEFISEFKNQCRIVTDLPDIFVDSFFRKNCIDYYSSKAVFKNGILHKTHILDKGSIPDMIGQPVVSVGCYDSDAEMIGNSIVGIGYGGALPISNSVLKNATHAIYSEDRLCRFLRQL